MGQQESRNALRNNPKNSRSQPTPMLLKNHTVKADSKAGKKRSVVNEDPRAVDESSSKQPQRNSSDHLSSSRLPQLSHPVVKTKKESSIINAAAKPNQELKIDTIEPAKTETKKQDEIVQVVPAPEVTTINDEPLLQSLAAIQKYFGSFFGTSNKLSIVNVPFDSQSIYNLGNLLQNMQKTCHDKVSRKQVKSLDEFISRNVISSTSSEQRLNRAQERLTTEVDCSDIQLGRKTQPQFPTISRYYKKSADKISKLVKIADGHLVLPRNSSTVTISRNTIYSEKHMDDLTAFNPSLQSVAGDDSQHDSSFISIGSSGGRRDCDDFSEISSRYAASPSTTASLEMQPCFAKCATLPVSMVNTNGDIDSLVDLSRRNFPGAPILVTQTPINITINTSVASRKEKESPSSSTSSIKTAKSSIFETVVRNVTETILVPVIHKSKSFGMPDYMQDQKDLDMLRSRIMLEAEKRNEEELRGFGVQSKPRSHSSLRDSVPSMITHDISMDEM